MPDENGTLDLSTADLSALSAAVPALNPVAPVAAPPVVSSAVESTPVVVEPLVNTEVLKSILMLFGHDVSGLWDEAVSLARKVI